MKNLAASLVFCSLLLSPISYAGVVMELVTQDPSGQETGRTKFFSQAGKIRMDQREDDDSPISMIFLGNEFLILQHENKSYMVMDEAMLDEVSTQISAAMKQMEAQLANMPPEQRAMMEKMMKGQMQGMMGQNSAPPPQLKVEAEGTAKWLSYECRKYSVYEDAEKTQDVCAAGLDQIGGGDEMMQAFQDMAAFLTKMTESMPMGATQGINPGELMDQIGGFPIHTIEYENGKVAAEVSLESVVEQDLDSGLFSAPADYRRSDPFGDR